MFIAHQNVAQLIQMGISDYPKRVVAIGMGREIPIVQYNVVSGGTALSVGIVLSDLGFYRVIAYNKRGMRCGESEVTVIEANDSVRHVPSGRRRRTIQVR